MIQKVRRNNDQDAEDDDRELNLVEEKLLKQFEENDQEIDGMLDIVLEKMDNIKLHAEDIGTEINK